MLFRSCAFFPFCTILFIMFCLLLNFSILPIYFHTWTMSFSICFLLPFLHTAIPYCYRIYHLLQIIQLAFSDFHVAMDSDLLVVYDGGEEIARLEGHNTPAVLVASSGEMTLHFTSDDSTTRKGFTAEYITTCRFYYT